MVGTIAILGAGIEYLGLSIKIYEYWEKAYPAIKNTFNDPYISAIDRSLEELEKNPENRRFCKVIRANFEQFFSDDRRQILDETKFCDNLEKNFDLFRNRIIKENDYSCVTCKLFYDDLKPRFSDEVKKTIVDNEGNKSYIKRQLSPEDTGKFDEQLARFEDHLKGIKKDTEDILKKLGEIQGLIERSKPETTGAAVSNAVGYFSNFVLRFWENIGNGITDQGTNELFKPDASRIHMNIYLPRRMDSDLSRKIIDYYQANVYRRGIVSVDGLRSIDFRYKKIDDDFIICDIPTAIATLYSMYADVHPIGGYDKGAEEHYLAKEIDSFAFALHRLMAEDAVASKLKTFRDYQKPDGTVDEEKIKRMQRLLENNVAVKKIDLYQSDL